MSTIYYILTPFVMSVVNYIVTRVICDRYQIFNERNSYDEICVPKRLFLNIATSVLLLALTLIIFGQLPNQQFGFIFLMKMTSLVLLFWVTLVSFIMGMRHGVPNLSRFINTSLDNIKLRLSKLFKMSSSRVNNDRKPDYSQPRIEGRPIVIELDPNGNYVSKLD